MKKLKIEELKKDLERNFESYEYCITDYYNDSNCIDDIIFKIADTNIDIYNYDLLEWTKNNYYYIEQYVQEFGIDEKNFDFIKLIQGGQYMEIEQNLYNNKNNMLLYLIYYILEQQGVEEITEEQDIEINMINFNNIDTITELEDIINEILKESEE